MNQSLYIIKHKSLYKIGISKHAKLRKKQISQGLGGDSVRLLFSFAFWQPARLERFLHGYFGKYRKTHKGTGKTEYFKLGMLRVLGLILALHLVALIQRCIGLCYFGLACYGFYCLIFN